jgi:hypothetical protein
MEKIRIRDPGSGIEKSRFRDPGWKKVGSGISTPDPQHCFNWFLIPKAKENLYIIEPPEALFLFYRIRLVEFLPLNIYVLLTHKLGSVPHCHICTVKTRCKGFNVFHFKLLLKIPTF